MRLNVVFVGVEANEQTPALALYQVSADGLLRKIASLESGQLEVGEELAKRSGEIVALGPDVEDPNTLDPEGWLRLRLGDHSPTWEQQKQILIPRLWWRRWLFWTACVSGKVKCRHWWLDLAALKTSPLPRRTVRPLPFWRVQGHSHDHDAAGATVDLTKTSQFSLVIPPAHSGPVEDEAPETNPLSFLLYFHPNLKGLGAYYYRLSIVAEDATGAPAGTPQPILNPVSWLNWVPAGTQWEIQMQALGPNSKTVGATLVRGLFQIPYATDAFWVNGQYHGWLDTRQYASGRYLLLLELFDSAGRRLVPTGLPAGVGEVSVAFDCLQMQNAAKLRSAAPTHLFWFDDLPVYGRIRDLDANSLAASEQRSSLNGSAVSNRLLCSGAHP